MGNPTKIVKDACHRVRTAGQASSGTRRRYLLIASLLLISAVIIWVVTALPTFTVGVHQRAITHELSGWKSEYGTIESQHDAVRAAEMLEYVRGYYVSGEGYRSTPKIEAALESQRQNTIDAFVGSLREYTKQDFGSDSAKWLAFLQSLSVDDSRMPED